MLFLYLNHDLNDTPCTKNPEYYNTSGCRIINYYSHVVAYCSSNKIRQQVYFIFKPRLICVW